jgi:hypothetical protein
MLVLHIKNTMKKILFFCAFFIAILAGCVKSTDDTKDLTIVKPKVTLMVANQINVNNVKQQMIRISVRFDGSAGLHEWTDLALGEGYQPATGMPTYHNAGILPLQEYGFHAIQIFFSGGGTAYWEQYSFVQDKSVYLRAYTNSNGNAAIITLDGIPPKSFSGF